MLPLNVYAYYWMSSILSSIVVCSHFDKKTDSWATLLTKWADKITINESLKRCFLKIRRILQFKIKLTKMPRQTMANTITTYSNVLFLHSNADSYQEFIWWFVIWEIDYWNLLALQLCVEIWMILPEIWTDNKFWTSTGRYICAICNFQADKKCLQSIPGGYSLIWAVLVINCISILAILPLNSVSISFFLRRSYFFITPSFSHPHFAFLYVV